MGVPPTPHTPTEVVRVVHLVVGMRSLWPARRHQDGREGTKHGGRFAGADSMTKVFICRTDANGGALQIKLAQKWRSGGCTGRVAVCATALISAD
jgi:hypothetical protein